MKWLAALLLVSVIVALATYVLFVPGAAVPSAVTVATKAKPAVSQVVVAEPPSTRPREIEENPNTPLTTVLPIAEAPKLDVKHEHKALLPDRSLLMETTTDAMGKPKPVRLLVECDVCLRRGPLELFLCRKETKEHEAILRTAVDAKLLHAGLIALGAKPGSPVQFIDPKTEMEDYKPATGEMIDVAVHYRHAGKLHTHAAQDWIRDVKTMKPMAHPWVFAGSQFIKYEYQPERQPYYAANGGDVISVSNFRDSMLDLPVRISDSNSELIFEAEQDKIPPVLTKVWVILTVKKP